MARTSSVSPSITRTPQVKALVAASWPKVSDRSAPTYELGDLLLSSFKLAPVQPTQRRTKRSQSHGVMILEGSLALISWITLLRGGLPRRIYDLVGGIFLVSSAGICYLSVCHLLRKVSSTKYISELLLDRSNPRSWPREKRRLFLEVCTWMAIVLLLYITTHSSWIAILAGALVAAVLAFVSDFLAASLYLLETKQEPQHMKSIGGMLWLKVALSYGCVGYIISDTGRMLHTYVFGQEETKQQLESLHQLVFNYLLITLVGASLIIASELLLLCTPTRRAGIVLQSRIVDARKNWEQHSLRSLVEVTGTFGTTILYYSSTRDMLVSLQLGTCCGVLLILGSELLASACTSHFVSPPSPQAAVEMPADHWVKLIPVIVMMLYFALQLYAAIVRAANQPSSSLVLMLCFVAIAAIMLTGLALSGRKPSLLEVTRSGRRLAAKICVGLITLIAPKVSYGWSGVIFSCVLSAFCIAFSRECWDDIELIDEMVLENIGRPPEGTDIVSTLIVNTAWMTDVSHSWSTRVLSFVKARYFHFYRRLKWTFVGIMVVSTLDICSTFFAVIQQDRLSLSLSQYSAINVVVSASVGYLTSPAPHELHPAELLYTGVQQFKNKWVIFPLHMFVEALVFLGVFVGTFAASSTVFSSITLAALSGLVVSVGGHWLCSHLQLTVETHMRMQLTATCALLFCLFLITYASMISLFSIYHYFDSIEAAFCLASLAGIFFLAASELFLMWEPTREIGLLLQRRVTNASENWQQEPLRSFLELFTWFAVICGSFAMYDDLVLALQLGTLSGIAVTLSGEFFRKNRSKFIPWGKDYLADEKRVAAPLSPVGGLVGDPDRARPLPVMLLFAYIGSGTFHWIFDNMRSLEVTVGWCDLTRPIYQCKTKLARIPIGTLSGILVTLGGEQLRNCARSIPLNESDREVLEKSQILPLPVMGLLGLVGAVAFNIIYTHLRRIEVAFVLATTSGVIFALIGDMFVIWTPTRKVGMILQERLLFFKMNFTCHTCRSWMEVASLCCGWYLSYNLIWPEDLLIAIQFGTTTGILACVSGELTMEYVAKAERRLIANASAKLAQNLQKDSLFFSLPYEIQFRVAHFLTAEDLLVVRATCSRVNSMLKAESARFWLHASLRRTKRDQRGRTRDHEINHRMGNRARSLVYEAITLVLPMIVGTRNPAQILTSRNEVNRALKWVYLNANWIRKQNLPPMHNETEIGGSTLIVLKAGDIAFDVFRYMPDKSSLGIIINRNEDFAIEQVHVPLSVYDMIQRDPFSFVAAETLSTLEVFSTWHLTVVAFAAMTLIFIGQIINDLLRAYMMGSETIWI
ncbi:F-box domain [Plasmopara halstedii]|uniref:F-box domain n=1 Tax=Plasmopara halstedii TaxID=4781 RepID=A0A0P1AT50_PLAHL|nr:F-box domain [Plasmopara halstedii]CEG44364.1 F-box domain [Plasmopara halstedii]|eukprot:XP_024580733.1 F-box domain [Plasmopara halstedii]